MYVFFSLFYCLWTHIANNSFHHLSAPIGYMIVVYIKGLWCMVFSVYTLLQKFVYHAGAPHGGLGTCFIYPQRIWVLPYWRNQGHYKPVPLFVLLNTIIVYANTCSFLLFYFVFHFFLKPALWLQNDRHQSFFKCNYALGWWGKDCLHSIV